VLFEFERFVLAVGQGAHECASVNFISYRHLRVARQVHSIQLVEQVRQLVLRETVVNGNHANARLLEELNVGAWHVTWHSIVRSLSDLVLVHIILSVKVTAHGLGEDSDDGSLAVVDELGVLEVSHLGHHIFLNRSVLPRHFEVLS